MRHWHTAIQIEPGRFDVRGEESKPLTRKEALQLAIRRGQPYAVFSCNYTIADCKYFHGERQTLS